MRGFFVTVRKSVEYSRILEVTMTSGVLQKPKGLCSIALLTAATTDGRQSGIKLVDIKDPDENYSRIRQIVQKRRGK